MHKSSFKYLSRAELLILCEEKVRDMAGRVGDGGAASYSGQVEGRKEVSEKQRRDESEGICKRGFIFIFSTCYVVY